MLMHQPSSEQKMLSQKKRENYTFTVLNIDKKFKESQTQIIVKIDDEVHFISFNQQFTFCNENKLQIQVIIQNKIFGSITFKPKIINKIPNQTTKWITLLEPSDDSYDGDFIQDDLEEPKMLITLAKIIQPFGERQIKQRDQTFNYNNDNIIELTNQNIQSNFSIRDNSREKMRINNRDNSKQLKENKIIESQKNKFNVLKQNQNIKQTKEDINEKTPNQEVNIKEFIEKINNFKIKLEQKEKENQILSHNIQKIENQYIEVQKQVKQDEIKTQQKDKHIKKCENKIQKLTDYLIDLKQKHMKLQLEYDQSQQKLKEQEERISLNSNNEQFKEQVDKNQKIIEDLNLLIQIFQNNEIQKEQQIKQLQQQLNIYQHKKEESIQIEQVMKLNQEKSLKIESLIQEINSHKKQVESLTDQIKIFEVNQKILKNQVNEKNIVIISQENKEIQLQEQIKDLKSDILDQIQQIDEQKQHIENQYKFINEQNQELIKYKQNVQRQQELIDLEIHTLNNLTNENLKKEYNNSQIQQKIVKKQQNESNQYNQNIENNRQQDVMIGNSQLSNKFWKNIPDKIADLEKVIAEYDQKHLLINQNNSELNNVNDNPLQGINDQNNLKQSTQNSEKFKEKQCTQPQSVIPFQQLENISFGIEVQQSQRMKEEEKNIPVIFDNYHLIASNQKNMKVNSPFSTLSVSEDNQVETNKQISLEKNTSIRNQPSNRIETFEQQQENIQQDSQNQENEHPMIGIDDQFKNKVQLNNYRNKRYQLRVAQNGLDISQSVTKSLDSLNQLQMISNYPNPSTKLNLDKQILSPLEKGNSKFKQQSQSLQNSESKSQRSKSINNVYESKKITYLSLSQKKRNNSTNEIKKWKI